MSTSSPDPAGPGAGRRSMALLVVLSILALISILVLSFFARATRNRTISFASAGQSRADSVAQTALQTIIGDLREEIRAGSTEVAGSSGYPIYVPSTNLNMLPQRLGSDGVTNLFKESVGGSNLWSGAQYQFPGPIRSLAGNSTTNAGPDGRYLPLSFWQKPQLLAAAENTLLRPPDWVPVTRTGALSNAPAVGFAALTNSSPANLTYAVGRYAYTVYEIGGLLDANVAGYHSQSGLSASDLARKGSLAVVPLAGIGGLTQTDVDALVKWRNPTAYNSYSNYVFQVARTNGFLYPPAGNQGFLSRQDLIAYAASNGITAALPYLTSFSREKNSPSWSPSATLSPASYAAAAETVGSANRDLANLRAPDGTALIKSRFDLDRLAWVTYEGPSASLPSTDPLYNANGTAANIQKYFGLVWDSTAFTQTTERGQQWIYVSPDGSGTTPATIKTLDQVSGREPDFFELLKAGILSGSLAMYSQQEFNAAAAGNGSSANAMNYRLNAAGRSSSNTLFNQVPDYQVFAIGANIANQYQKAYYPIVIQTQGGNVTGITSLPYMLGWTVEPYRPTPNCPAFASAPPNPYRSLVGFWMQFVVWNPHRNAANASTLPQPAAFRASISKGVVQPLQWAYPTAYGAPITRDFSVEPVTLSFKNSTAFVDPMLLSPAQATGYSDPVYPNWGTFTDLNGKSIAGLFLGMQNVVDTNVVEAKSDPTPPPGQGSSGWNDMLVNVPTPTTLIDLRFQYQVPGGWRSYQMANNAGLYYTAGTYPFTNSVPVAAATSTYGDPRDHRLGPGGTLNLSISAAGVAKTPRNDASTWAFYATYMNNGGYVHLSPPFGNYAVSREFAAAYADNVASSTRNGPQNTYYNDPDGVVRPGDARDLGQIPPAPLAVAGASRPLVLAQPFHSVADLGYADRDLPWKTLDFTTASSADAGLLDLFSLNGGVSHDLPVVAGKVDLNAAPAPVLQALLSGAALDFGSDVQTVSNTLPSGDVTTLVNALRPASGTAPAFVNKSDLVSFLSTNMPSATANPAYQIKSDCEGPIRALTDVVQTRTWNLLIDVVAQSGRYAPGATGPDQFLVEGEKHYWLQIAIDRFTGEIVDQQLEPVYEH